MKQRIVRGATALGGAVLAAATLGGCATAGSDSANWSEGGLNAEIRRTAYGIPHIKANDYASLAFGMGYAYAQDNVCLMADQVVTVSGDRSRVFGPDESTEVSFKRIKNSESDPFFRAIIDDDALRAGYAQASPEARELLRGYIAGYNRYLRDTPPAQRPAGCRNADWVRPVTAIDMFRLAEEKSIQASAGALAAGIVAAVPPRAAGSAKTVQQAGAVDVANIDFEAVNNDLQLLDPPIGSNGWAFGKEATTNGRGLLLGNPHFPWTTTNRFFEAHLTVPGKLDVMGASIASFPIISIGFNKDVAWTHTVSTARRFTLYELKLAEGDPTTYLVDGAPRKMTPRTVSYAAKLPDGRTEQRSHTFYMTEYGPVLSMPSAGLPWSAQKAYTLRDANRNNTRSVDTWLDIGRARDVAGIRTAIGRLGIPWVNTIATDREGRAMFADVSVAPNVSAAMLKQCAPAGDSAALATKLMQGTGMVLLDGTRASCNWTVDAASPVPGLTAPNAMPVLVRDDYVANSNDSSWLSNPSQKLTGFSPVLGPTEVAQRLRTRVGLMEIGRRLSGEDGLPGNRFDVPGLQAVLFRDRNLSGELVLDDLLNACLGTKDADLSDGCAALRKWDRHSNLDSRAAPLFREFWMRASKIPKVYAIEFNSTDPVNTPRGLRMRDESVRTEVFKALKDAVQAMRTAGFALDAPLGQVQAATAPTGRIALHGGEEYEGVLNKLQSTPVSDKGLQVYFGTSYVQTVGFDEQGPVAEALLVYGQSVDQQSAHAFDQMAEYSAKRWVRLPFSEQAIAADPQLKVTQLSQ
ncbi:acyl-homoserine lactone acylase [Cupriavidus basilensis OR16]|uniref:Acyl-homoserine lactone acylase n=1 Tax=Cupriavidus basilensis OR16 TaxID=1127483 RepID=H1S833_9BURK|nr:acylase [Cupriavidus basilensis]EHP41302.1 acyl-homoserine lactone acylase [Cupriavidus basilensis OR16]